MGCIKTRSLHYTGHRMYQDTESTLQQTYNYQDTQSTLHRTWDVSRHGVYITPDTGCIKTQSLHYSRHITIKTHSLHYTGHGMYQGTESTLHRTQDVSRHRVYITADI